jgi:type I restriction enzyme S subunit
MELIKLKDTVDILTGCAFKGDKYSDKGIRVVRGENVTEGKLRWDTIKCWNIPFDKEEFYGLKADDIVIGMDGSKVGKNKARIFIKDLPLLLAQRVACLRSKENVDQVYLYYCINNPRFEDYVYRIQTGSSVPHISKTQIEEFQIPFPILSTQKQIAKVLSDLDAKIEINNKINQELEAMAKTLYDYWFVQFDFPDATGKPYKSSGGNMVFNEELKRKIPVGWEVKEINKVIEVKDGTHDSPKSIDKGFKLITSKHLKVEGLDFDSANSISEEDYMSINKRSQVDTGDILFSMIGSIGTIYKVEEKNIDFAIKNVALYKTSGNQNLKNYIYMYLKGYDMQKYMGNVIAGSIQKFIGLGSLRKMPIMFDEKTISNFEVNTKAIFNQINTLKLENQKLSELRDWLLPMLMNGQVTVGYAEKEVEGLGLVAEGGIEYKKE